jgi:hypothetical protein
MDCIDATRLIGSLWGLKSKMILMQFLSSSNVIATPMSHPIEPVIKAILLSGMGMLRNLPTPEGV